MLTPHTKRSGFASLVQAQPARGRGREARSEVDSRHRGATPNFAEKFLQKRCGGKRPAGRLDLQLGPPAAPALPEDGEPLVVRPAAALPWEGFPFELLCLLDRYRTIHR